MKAHDWDARYETEGVWSREPNAWVEATLRHLDPGTAVDLAAGEGRNALWLASLGWEVTAVDFSSVGLATGRARAAESGVDVEWVTADATTWVSPQLVDLVLIAYLQVPTEQLALAIGTAAGYLAPGGTLAIVGHDRAGAVGGPKDPALLYTVEELRAAASGLEIVTCESVERVTDAGVALDTVLVARAG